MNKVIIPVKLLSTFLFVFASIQSVQAENKSKSQWFVSKGEPVKVVDPEPLPNYDDEEGMEIEALRKERRALDAERRALEKEREATLAEDKNKQKNEDKSQTSDDPRSLTRLRLDDRPAGTWHKGANTILKEVRAVVRNVGSVKASGIKVTAYAPGGKAFELEGPSALEKNEKAEYYAAPSHTVTIAGNIEVKMTCANCRR